MSLGSSELRFGRYDAVKLLALNRCRGVGKQRALRFALGSHRHELVSAGLHPRLGRTLTPREARLWLKIQEKGELEQTEKWAREEHARHLQIGARLIGFFDPEYPPLLRLTPSPPPVLFVLGDLTPCSNRHLSASTFSLQDPIHQHLSGQGLCIAVVGTRHPTPKGLHRAYEVSQNVIAMNHRSPQDFAGGIISGLALGVDACAHRAALDADGYTIAVLGHGLDQCYPQRHRSLADQILSNGGALISEQPWATPPHPYCLVARDRIQAGLSAGVVIAETGHRGGALHAARAALRQRRFVCLPSDHKARLSEVDEFKRDEYCELILWIQNQSDLSNALKQISLHSHQLNITANRLTQRLTQPSATEPCSMNADQQSHLNQTHDQQLSLFK